FSLIELLIAIAIFSVILIGIYPVFSQITTFNQENYIKTTLIDNLRAGMDRMQREIKEATKIIDPDDINVDSNFPDNTEKNAIVFRHPDPQNPESIETVRYRITTGSYTISKFPGGKQIVRDIWNGTSWEGGNPISEPTISNIIFKKEGQLIKICIISSVILRKGKPAQDYIYLGNVAVRNALP
ncbi:MAG: PulJ/GspJ family protein, partial [Caldisericia bacterium]